MKLEAIVNFEKVIGPYYGPAIEFPTSLGLLDLHNFAQFTHLVYDSDGNLSLHWRTDSLTHVLLGSMHKAAADITLIFGGVRSLSVTPRDPEMPLSADQTLDHFLVDEAHPGHYRMRLVFAGGMEIEVRSTDVRFMIAVPGATRGISPV